MDCVFCKIATREIPATIRYEDAEVMAFDTIKPNAPTHVLVIPKRHIPSCRELADADAPVIGQIVLTARRLAEDLGIAEGGYRLTVNCGENGGQVIPHLHLHLMGGQPLGGEV